MSERLGRSAGLIGLATLTSRVLGMVRNIAQAAFFATGQTADAFVVATRLPTLLRDLFAEGAMSAAFVPTFTRHLTLNGKPAAWRLGSHVINALLVVTGVIVLIGIAFAGPLARFYAEGYSDTPEKLALTTSLARINMPFLMLVSVAAACMGMLNALRRFFIPAASPALYNVAFILCLVILVPLLRHFGMDDAIALSAGMLIGGVAQIVAQWPALRREGYRHSWELDFRDPALREILILMAPGTIGAAAAQVNLLVNTWLATNVDHAASGLTYAFQLMYMPIGIIGVSLATAAIPNLARHAAEGAHDQMRTTLSWGIRLMLMLSVPATVGLMVLARPIVEMIYEHGRFTALDTTIVSESLLFYAPGILGYSIVKIASPSFYSLQDARTPLMVSVIAIVTNLVLNLSLFPLMSYRGLALGTAIAANLNAGLLLFLLSRRIGGVDARRLATSFVKILIASAIMAVAVYWTEAWLAGHLPVRLLRSITLARVLRVSLAIGAGVGTLALAAWAMRMEEFQRAVSQIGRRLRS